MLSRDELNLLRQLRARFLADRAADGGYWRSREELALYDRTLAERIGWKWDAVLRELSARGWQPSSRTVLDWGCGSGVAARRVLAAWRGHFSEVRLHDVSALARDFARESVAHAFPALRVTSEEACGRAGETLLLISHVLNELPDAELDALLGMLRQADEIIWVESGTLANSRRLVAEVRERLVGSGDFAVVAPCTHREVCGLFAPGNERHWCHSFAPPPRALFQDAEWMRLGRDLGIDLRAAPYAFLVLAKTGRASKSGAARVIGRPRDYKGYSKVLSCEAGGVQERMLQKRDAPALLKQVQAEPVAPIFQWELAGERIVGGSLPKRAEFT